MDVADASQESQQNAMREARGVGKRGGWITFPFIAVSTFGVGLAINSTITNIMVYMLKEYNVKSINSAQIHNVIVGCQNFSPVAGAIIADAFFGSYPVVVFSTVVSVLAFVLYTLTAAIRSLRPPACAFGSDLCEPSSAGQLGFLYTAVGMMVVANGGTRFNIITMGANQFNKVSEQDSFVNWYLVVNYASGITGLTAIVYLESSISWTVGYGVCAAASAIAVVALLAGARHYRRVPPKGSPFTGLARVAVASARKWKITMWRQENLNYYFGTNVEAYDPPTKSFSFLNGAASISPGDTRPDGSLAKPWNLCTVEQVEDFKTLLRIFPLWTASIAAAVALDIEMNLAILQAITMDRSIGPHFTIPPSTIIVAIFIGVIISLVVLDRLLLPQWQKLTGRTLTPIQRIGISQFFYIASMVVAALVERRREHVVRAHQAEGLPRFVVPMSALWLVLPLGLIGVAEALHYPGQIALYYQEFPKSLRSTSTAMLALVFSVASYISVGVLHLIRRNTSWLHNNINSSRIDKVYWAMAAMVAINFVYFIVCAKLYNYQNYGKEKEFHATELELAATVVPVS